MLLKAKLRHWLFALAALVPGAFSTRLKRAAYFIEVSKILRTSKVPHFGSATYDLFNSIMEQEGLRDEGLDYLEFGVSHGWSLLHWITNCKSENARFYGFDTFDGIPEDWGSVKKGAYSAQGKLPDIKDNRASFIVGLFADTLPAWLGHASLGRRKVIHLDADLYSSTLFVLITLHSTLRRGDILIFDEFFSVTKADHEYRAFADSLTICPLHYVPIAKSCNQFAIKIL